MEASEVEERRMYGISGRALTELICDSQQGLFAIGLDNGMLKM